MRRGCAIHGPRFAHVVDTLSFNSNTTPASCVSRPVQMTNRARRQTNARTTSAGRNSITASPSLGPTRLTVRSRVKISRLPLWQSHRVVTLFFHIEICEQCRLLALACQCTQAQRRCTRNRRRPRRSHAFAHFGTMPVKRSTAFSAPRLCASCVLPVPACTPQPPAWSANC